MARMIYPGVYVLDTPQTPEYRQSKAGKYTDIYTNQRYENWQTSLKLAEMEYKKDYDAYTAKEKATKQVLDNMDQDLAAERRASAALEGQVLTNSEKTKQYMATKETDRSKWIATQVETNARANAHNKAMLGTYVTADQDRKTVDEVAGGMSVAYEDSNSWNNVKAMHDSLSTRKDAATNGPEDSRTTWKSFLDKASAKTGKPISEIIATAPTDIQDDLYDSLTVGSNVQTKTSGNTNVSSNPRGGYQIHTPNIDPEQADRISQLEEIRGTDYARTVAKNVLGVDWKPTVKRGDPDYVIGSLNVSQATKAAASVDSNNRQAPSSDIIGNARNIYGTKFESLPAFEKKQQLDQTKQYLDTFINWKISKLPSDASIEDISRARQDGIAAAVYYAQHGRLDSTPEKAPIQPPVVPTTAENLITKGSEPMALSLAAKGISSAPEDKTMHVSPDEIRRIMGLPPKEDVTFNESTPVVEPTPTLPAKLGGPVKETTADIAAKAAASTVAKQASTKEQDMWAASQEIIAGKGLMDKPKLAERKLANTSVGQFVTDLFDSNQRLDTPQEWVGLRKKVIDAYADEPMKRDQALKLLSYKVQLQATEGRVVEPKSNL